MRWIKHSKRRIANIRFDSRWLFPITVIVIAGVLAFSAEIKERTAARSRIGTSATAVNTGHTDLPHEGQSR